VRTRDLVDYGLLSLIWGLSFVVLVRVANVFGLAGAVALRALVAGACLLVFAAASRRRLDFSVGWWPFVVIGATTVAIQLLGLSYAAPRIGTAMSAILVATIPLFSVVIARLWGLEVITRPMLVGLLLGAVGLVLLVGFPAVRVTTAFVVGCAAAIVGSAAAAFGSNYAQARMRRVGSYETTTGSFLFGGVMTLPLLIVLPVPTTPAPVDYAYLLLLGAVMSALAYVLYFRLVADIGATRTITVEFVVTAVAVIVGALLLHERLTVVQLVGGVVIIAGCALVLGVVPRRRSVTGRTG
jgi:drug/metabolite transporter (DMT)-like permease